MARGARRDESRARVARARRRRLSAAPIVERDRRHGDVPSAQLAAILAVSAAVAEGGALVDTLTTISRTAAELVEAEAAAIILRESESDTGLAVAASHGLSETYAEHLERLRPLEIGKGPTGLAAERGRPVSVDDVLSDPLFGPWRDLAIREHYRSMVSVPLRPKEGRVIGVLNAYRDEPGSWTAQDVNLLSLLSDHAAIAIRTANLLDSRRRQVDGLSLMVRSLRAQAHEHSNRLHAIHGLLALGEPEQAIRLIAAVEAGYHGLYGQVTARIENVTIAGFLVAESAVARESGIEVTLDRTSKLGELPPRLDDLDAITLLGNLIHNAVEAVSAMPKRRRKVTVRLSHTAGQTVVLRVRDWGPGIPAEVVSRMFERDVTTKPGHSGIGLSLVKGIVDRARGRIEVERPKGGGTAILVMIPS